MANGLILSFECLQKSKLYVLRCPPIINTHPRTYRGLTTKTRTRMHSLLPLIPYNSLPLSSSSNSSNGIRNRQSGHDLRTQSQFSIQPEWNLWLQGISLASPPTLNFSKQIEQSSFAVIVTLGIDSIAAFFKAFFFVFDEEGWSGWSMSWTSSRKERTPALIPEWNMFVVTKAIIGSEREIRVLCVRSEICMKTDKVGSWRR